MDLVIGDREKREMEGVEVGVANGNETEKKDEVLVVGDEGAAAVCIPPRNALLLMRCRSDPVRMAALANQFWGSPATKVEVEEEEEEEEGEEGDVEVGQHLFGLVEVDREKVRVGRDEAVAAAKARPETGKPGKEAAEEEKSSQGAIFHAALEERESSAEKKQQRSSEEKQDENENREESLKERPSAHCAEVKRNPPREEVENAQLLEKSEEMAVKEETDLLDREEVKEGEEGKGRRFSNCSSSMGKEERRSHNHKCLSKAKEGGRRLSSSSTNKEKRRHSFSTERDARKHGFSNEREDRRASFSIEGKKRWSFSINKEDLIPEEENALHEEEEEKKEEDSSVEGEEAREIEAVEKPKEAEEEEIEVNGGGGSKEEENGRGEKEVKGDEEKRGELPDCLLLMMYEPKVSMEVSKETWVCSTDFLRRLPHHRRQLPQGSGGGGGGGGGGERAKTERVGGGENKEVKTPAEPAALQVAPPPPPRAPPTASAIEQKLMSAAAEQAGPAASAYGPFVLTRCKSEPMRTSARLAPDACFWKDGRRPIGAAGIGF